MKENYERRRVKNLQLMFALSILEPWTGSVIGVEAVKHRVESWKIPVNLGPDAAGSCES